jgi:hypothetical protein
MVYESQFFYQKSLKKATFHNLGTLPGSHHRFLISLDFGYLRGQLKAGPRALDDSISSVEIAAVEARF